MKKKKPPKKKTNPEPVEAPEFDLGDYGSEKFEEELEKLKHRLLR